MRQMAVEGADDRPAPGSARVLAVTSGKGGVGKTNVAVNLAARLALMGRRVVLMDADLGMANADVLCNLNARATLAHVLTGRCTLADVMVDGPGGFTLIPGVSGLAAIADLSAFERARILEMVSRIEEEHDLLMIDTGAGISAHVLSFVEAADEVLVVTTPEPTAITDAYGLIKTLSRRTDDVDVSVLVNQVRDRKEARRVFDRLDVVCRRFLGIRPLNAGCVMSDPNVISAVRRREPFVLSAPDCPASGCIRQLAHKLDRHAADPHSGGFFKKFASWLAG